MNPQTVKTEYVTLEVSDGTQMQCYVAQPEQSGSYPGLMLFQEAFGVNGHIRSVAERLATEGYVVIAPELFHRTATGFEGDYQDFASCAPHMQAMTLGGQTRDIGATFEWLKSHASVKNGMIGAIGFCMGGRVSFLANAELPLRAAVSYYGARINEMLERTNDLHGPMLFYWGGLDKHITPEIRDAVTRSLREAGKEFISVEISTADHAFNCDLRPAYNPQAAKEAWTMTLQFLRDKLGE